MEGLNVKKIAVPVIVISAAALWSLYMYLRSVRGHWKFREKTSKEIHIVNTTEEWDRVYPLLVERCSTITAVGFDCEWVFWGHRLPVALIQLATHDGLCVLVRIFLMESVPSTLRQFFSDRSILKVGVAARDDGRKLFKDYGIIVSGCVDLRHILARVRGFQCPSQSLQGLAKGVLDVSMVKDMDIRCGDWEAKQLSSKQINYAADDALIGMDIFMQMLFVKIFGIRARRKHFYGSEINLDETVLCKTVQSLSQGIVDIAYKSKMVASLLQNIGDSSGEEGDEEPVNASQQASASGCSHRKLKASKKAFMTRQRPLYYNCQLLAPDGECLTLCDIRKAEWYIKKGIGVKVCDDPFSVQLKFEPRNRPATDRDYYLQDKENRCVVCGANENYVRKIVVPQEYRKYFPAILKDHSSHDIVLVCVSCHLMCADYEGALRQKLSTECAAPLDSGKDSERQWDQDLAKVVSAARALLKSRDKIPESRIKELEATVKLFYGVQTLPKDLLQQALCMQVKINNAKFVPHGKKVVEYYMAKEGGLLQFEKMWRQHFVDIMQPQFLPPLWSVEHRPERMKTVDVDI